MHQLCYISTARVTPTSADLDDILTVSRRNNSASGVTGLLVTGGNRFLQVLEGGVAEVTATYGRICADPRHFGCVVLASRSTDHCSFGEWAMAHEIGRAVGRESIVEAVRLLTEDMSDLGLQAEFRGFAEFHARAA